MEAGVAEGSASPRDRDPVAGADAGIDWSLGTHEGVRRAQEREFLALSFRERLRRIEQMCEVAARVTGQARRPE